MRKISGIIAVAAVASLAVACGDGGGDPPAGSGGTTGTGGTTATGGITGDGGTGGGTDGGTGGTTNDPGGTISAWDGGFPTYLGPEFNAAGPIYTYAWAGATCTLIPGDGEEVTDADNITVSGCAGGDYAGGGFAFAFCAAPTETWDELTTAIPGMATWAPESKHTWSECNPTVNLVDVTIPGLPACAGIEFQDASDTVVTDKNSAVSVNVKVDGVKGCSVENLDLSYVFTVG